VKVTLWDGNTFELSAELAQSLLDGMQEGYLGEPAVHDALARKLAAVCGGWDVSLNPLEGEALLTTYWGARERQDDLWAALYALLNPPLPEPSSEHTDHGNASVALDAARKELPVLNHLFEAIRRYRASRLSN
jgi:hypothetical protein